MLTIHIPGREVLTLSHLILDYNGTIAEDGKIIEGIAARLEALSQNMQIYVITADTHGTAAARCEGLPLAVKTFPTTDVGAIKAAEAKKLTGGVACIGNGFNDIGMSDVCDLSICVTGLISFAGLIAPHIARMMIRRQNSQTLVLSSLVGGGVLLISDILARTLYAAELPISILTTVIGVPILLWFMCKRRGGVV